MKQAVNLSLKGKVDIRSPIIVFFSSSVEIEFYFSGFLQLAKSKNSLQGKHSVFVLFPVNLNLVNVNAETLAVSGAGHPLVAKSSEVGGHIALSESNGDLLFAKIVELLLVLEEGISVTVFIPDNEVLTSITRA